MNNTFNVARWVSKNFFLISSAFLVFFYLLWFRLTPFVLGDDPTEAFVPGCILLIIFLVVSKLIAWTTNAPLKALLVMLNIPLLLINVGYLFVYIPWLETTAKCNGIRYYISHGAPFSDPQWTYVQMSKWKGISYESHFWGYAPDGGANEIRCDVDRKETLFLRTYAETPTLTYIDGEHPQKFYKYTGAKLRGYLYFISSDWYILENCNRDEYWTCYISVYQLYQCRSDYTNCHPLSITYTNSDVDFLELKANKKTNEIRLFDESLGSDDRTLIFIYGENSQCYVDGCTINNR